MAGAVWRRITPTCGYCGRVLYQPSLRRGAIVGHQGNEKAPCLSAYRACRQRRKASRLIGNIALHLPIISSIMTSTRGNAEDATSTFELAEKASLITAHLGGTEAIIVATSCAICSTLMCAQHVETYLNCMTSLICSELCAQMVPGVHDVCWVTSFISFLFLYPSTFNLLEVSKELFREKCASKTELIIAQGWQERPGYAHLDQGHTSANHFPDESEYRVQLRQEGAAELRLSSSKESSTLNITRPFDHLSF